MNPRSSLFAGLLCCLAFVLVDCSFIGTGKSDKKAAQIEQPKASAVEWKERKWDDYAKDQAGVRYFFEKESLAYPSKGLIHVWRKRILPERQLGLKEIIAFDEIDCRTEKYRSLEVQGTNRDGTSTEVFKKPSPWTTIYQDTADDYFLNNFCEEALKTQQTGAPRAP